MEPDSTMKKSLPWSPSANRISPASTRRTPPRARSRASCSSARRGKAPSLSGVSTSPAPIGSTAPVTSVIAQDPGNDLGELAPVPLEADAVNEERRCAVDAGPLATLDILLHPLPE